MTIFAKIMILQWNSNFTLNLTSVSYNVNTNFNKLQEDAFKVK